MGNASGKSDGEGTSGVKYEEEEEVMEFATQGGGGGATHLGYHSQGGVYAEAEPMLHSPPRSPGRLLQPPLGFTPQVPMNPISRPIEVMPTHNYASSHGAIDFGDAFSEKPTAVMITWTYGGKHIAVTGSWDNWSRREPLQRSGKDFILMKMLPPGVYHYRFIVDEHMRYAPDLPWECDDSGTAYNVLDVQDYVPEAPESLSEFQSPPSPESSYNNESIDEMDMDFSKPPPDIPPQLHLTLLNERSSVGVCELLSRPQHTVLNHFYIQNDHNQHVALGSTHRFLQKYVTVVLYKPSRR